MIKFCSQRLVLLIGWKDLKNTAGEKWRDGLQWQLSVDLMSAISAILAKGSQYEWLLLVTRGQLSYIQSHNFVLFSIVGKNKVWNFSVLKTAVKILWGFSSENDHGQDTICTHMQRFYSVREPQMVILGQY
jgi:hypothetical protein